MTGNELNRVIDKFMGISAHRCRFDVGEGISAWCIECGLWFANSKSLPRWCDNHDDARRFWDAIKSDRDRRTAIIYLASMVEAADCRYWDDRDAWKFINATPRQLAEAGARAIRII